MDFFRYARDYYGDWLPSQLLPQTAWLVVWLVVLFAGIHRLRRSVGEPRPTEQEGAADVSGEKYELGARWQINDHFTGKPATRNIFIEPPAGASDVMREVAVRALQSRGAIFWQCNNALNKVVDELSRDTKQSFDAVRAELIAGLLPGVKLIPAHTMLIGLAQEHGCTYEKR